MRGIRTTTNEVYKNIAHCNYDVIVFTETWLNFGVVCGEFVDDRYVVYRKVLCKGLYYTLYVFPKIDFRK